MWALLTVAALLTRAGAALTEPDGLLAEPDDSDELDEELFGPDEPLGEPDEPLAETDEPGEPLLHCHHELCEDRGGSYYHVEDKVMYVWVTPDDQSIKLEVFCSEQSVLDSPALPRANSEFVSDITLQECPLPANRSLGDTFAALNITFGEPEALRGPRLLLFGLPPEPPLTERHLLGLERLDILEIYGINEPELGFLRHLRNLSKLHIYHVKLPAGETFVPTLRTLRLLDRENDLNVISLPPGLLELELDSPGTTVQLNSTSTLRLIKLTNWAEKRPAPLTHCDLTSLKLVSPAMRELPGGWLDCCSRLRKLELRGAKRLKALSPRLLSNAGALTSLVIEGNALETLPAGLLDYAPNLRDLDLSGNPQLRMLPSDMFAVTRGVRRMELYSNNLARDVLSVLAPLEQLTVLNLANNRRIKDVCGKNENSPIAKLTQLTELILKETNLSRICPDWRQDMKQLRKLDLSKTLVSELWFEDLQFKRNVTKAEVLLYGAPLTLVGMTREDYNYAIGGENITREALIKIGSAELSCNCSMYWTRRALDAPNTPLDHISEMRCAGYQKLIDQSPATMLCADQKACAEVTLPAQCACGSRLDDDPKRHDKKLVYVSCKGIGLDHVPPINHTPRSNQSLYVFLLGNNSITQLRADELRSDIKLLDLRNNSLARVDEETAARLGSFLGELYLAGNPLDCSCRGAALLRALHTRTAYTDLEDAACSDGSALDNATAIDCPTSELGSVS